MHVAAQTEALFDPLGVTTTLGTPAAASQAPLPPAALGDGRLLVILGTHVLRPWFSRCVDRVNGGFRSDFDHRWRDTTGTPIRLLEFQARQTRAAALACAARPQEVIYRDACLHGFRYLRETLWDEPHGGWYHATSPAGEALYEGAKHAYGIAHAIQACLDVATVTGLEPARELALEGFGWLDAHAWDPGGAGYWGPLGRDGDPQTAPALAGPHCAPRDHLGTPLGAQDFAIACALIESLTALAARPGEVLAQCRLEALIRIVERSIVEHGAIPAWRSPVSGGATACSSAATQAAGSDYHAGLQFQAIPRLWHARRRLDLPLEPLRDLSLRLYEAGLQHSAPDGGVLSPNGTEEAWPQFERLRAAAHLGSVLEGPERGEFRGEAMAVWQRIAELYVDRRHDGLLACPAPGGLEEPKGSIRRDASPECAALLEVHALASRWA